jgi:prevent-host-death family protein
LPDIRVPVSDAKAQLTELVRRAEAGDEVILTRHGQPAVRLVAIKAKPDPTERRRRLEALRRSAAAKASAGPAAARSQDALYDEDGLPE